MMLSLDACRVDLLRGLVLRGETEVPLTTREGELLAYLAGRPCAPVSREDLLREVWGYHDAVVTRACDNTVRRLREKIEEDPQNPRHVLTVHGLGYRFVPSGAVAAESEPTPAESPKPAGVRFDLGPRRVDLARGVVVHGDEKAALTAKEIALLERLHAARGAVVERLALMRATEAEASPRAIDNLVARLRKKLEADPSEPTYLLTAPGGYRLDLGQAAEEQPAPHGRKALFAEICRTIAQRPFVLLYGPPGVGKSLLASAWGKATKAAWVDLRGTSDEEEIAERVARALDLGLGQSDPAERVAAALASEARNIVLDAIDAGVSGVSKLAKLWTAKSRDVRILATSQVLGELPALGLACIEVAPLDPDAAVELFVQKMRRKQTSEESPDPFLVRRIVDQLDYLPLSIELTAARTAILSLSALSERLSSGLLADPKLQSPLQASLSEALSRLGEEERAAIDILSIPKTFDVEDAETMLGDQALELVQALRDRSLLREDPASAGQDVLRFTVWQMLRSQLAALRAGAKDRGRAAVEQVVSALAAFASQGEIGPPSGYRRERMRVRLDDMARAVDLGLEHQIPLAARCAIGAGYWYCWHGPARAGIALCERALCLPGLDPRDERSLRYIIGQLHFRAGRLDDALRYLNAAIDSAGEIDPWIGSRARNMLASVLKTLGDSERAERALDEAERLARSSGDHAYADMMRAGALHAAGAFEEAIVCYEASIRSAGDARDLVTFSHYGIGAAAHHLGRLSVAAEHFSIASERWEDVDRTEWIALQGHIALVLSMLGARDDLELVASVAVEEARRDGWFYEEAIVYLYLGSARLFDGDLAPARTALSRARALIERNAGFPPLVHAYLEGRAADLALMEGQPQVAADLAARVERIAEATGSVNAALYGSHSAAVAALDLGDPDEAARRFEEARAKIASLPSRFDIGVHSARWALVAARLGQIEESEALSRRAEAQIQHTGASPRSELCWWTRAALEHRASPSQIYLIAPAG